MVAVPVRAMAAVTLLVVAPAAGAQAPPLAPSPTPPPIDPGAEMAPLPDLGIAWPDPSRVAPVAPEPAGTGTASPGATSDRAERYRVDLAGAEALGDAFRQRFDQLSALVGNQGKVANAAQINRRAEDDEVLVRRLLHAAGRYDGTVSTMVLPGTGNGSETVRLTVVPGDRYRFTSVTLPGLAATGAAAPALQRQFTVTPGDPVDADAVLAATAAFKAALAHEGYPFVTVGEPQVTVDHETRAATLALAVTTGALARFGRIVPLDRNPVFGPRHLAVVARFRPGQPYDAARLEDFRRALIQTGLVSTAQITPVATADPAVVDVGVRIGRAPPRTIAGELGYGTGEGARAEASWQHRNLIAPEGAVTFRGVAGTNEQSLGATLRQSNFHARDRVLTAQVVASHTNYNAYDARTFTLGAAVERQTNIIWQKKWVWSAGGEFVATDERDAIVATGRRRRRTFLVAALPGSLAYDGTDDLLNPTRGWRLSGRLSPEVSFQNGADLYAKVQIDASAYLPVGSRLVLAGRARFGTITGTERDDIAPSRRFYVGGGGSVRGYGYQDIGPLDVNGDPIGGRSLNEFAVEARIRFGAFGVVPFLDAGNLYTSSLPRGTGLRYGTGLGARYYSSFGPIRIDVGTPIARRRGESRVAVYVSLGQAF